MPRGFWIGLAVGVAGLGVLTLGGVALLTALAFKFTEERDDLVR